MLLSASASDPDRESRLLRHADSVYAMAHALTLNAEDATLLLEAVYQKAASLPLPSHGAEKEWLLRLLREEMRDDGGAPPDPSGLPARASGDFRRKLALRAVQRVLPAAFATLDRSEREILMLVHVERYDLNQAADIATEPVDVTEQRLDSAEATLRNAVKRNVSVGEHPLLEQLPPGWLPNALNEMVATDLPAMPPTVRPDFRRGHQSNQNRHSGEEHARRPSRKLRSLKPALRRLGVAALTIFFTGLLAYGAARILDRPPESNAIILSADAAGRPDFQVQTSDPEEAQNFILENLDWRLMVPRIADASLLGVEVREIAEGIVLPVLHYDDQHSEEDISVLVYNYALLDRAGERLRFERETLSQIEDAGHYELHDLGRQQVLVWRDRDDIFVAVTRGDAEALQDRLYANS